MPNKEDIKICIEAKSYSTHRACIDIPIYTSLEGCAKQVGLHKANGKVNIHPILRFDLDSLSYGRNEAVGSIGISFKICCEGQGQKISKQLDCSPCGENKVLRRNIQLLSELTPEYSTFSLYPLWDHPDEFVPELGPVIPFNNRTKINLSKQDRVKVHILKSKTRCVSHVTETRIWLVALVEFDNTPVMWILNQYWDYSQRYPSRYVLDRVKYCEMIHYLHSLFQPDEGGCDMLSLSGTIGNRPNKVLIREYEINSEGCEVPVIDPCNQFISELDYDLEQFERDVERFLDLYQ
jgi:hypothetical protein